MTHQQYIEVDLSQLDEHSESQIFELKESFDNRTLETIGAFANTKGGTILVGVRDNGSIIGISLGKNTLEEWVQKMQSKIQPRFFPSLSKRNYKRRTFVEITVERSESPIAIDGRFFKRVGRTNQLIGPEEVRQRLFASSKSSWDAQIVNDASREDLDDETINDFLSMVRAARRRPVGSERVNEILNKLELLQNGQPTRAAVLLFGKNPKKFFQTAFVQLGRFRSPTQIIDTKWLEGNILKQIEEGMIWFQQRFETEFIITGKPARDEKWEYPLPAAREALINAVCHREYDSDGTIQIRLYDDHLQISNPGGLPVSLTPDQLLQEHPSVPRNRLIANSLFYAGPIESWGDGTIKIVELCRQTGLETPEFVSSLYTFKIVIRKRNTATLEKMGLNQRQIAAVFYTTESGRITNREYQAQWRPL